MNRYSENRQDVLTVAELDSRSGGWPVGKAKSYRVEFFPSESPPIEIPATDELLRFLRGHGTPIGSAGDEPRFVVYRLAEPLRLAAAGLSQPLVQKLISLIAAYGDGRLLQSECR